MHRVPRFRVIGKEEKETRKRKRKEMLAAMSKKKDEEEEKLRGVYISLPLEEGNCWFEVDLLSETGTSNMKIKTKLSTPDERTFKLKSSLCSLPISDPGTAAIGSDIYVFGGSCKSTALRKASVYNTDDGVWSKLPKMRAARVAPKVVPCGGSIFVLGCSKTPTVALQPWGEKYEIGTGIWSEVPAPPIMMRGPSIFDHGDIVETTVVSCVILQNPTRILAYMTHSRTKLLYFSLHDWQWRGFPDIFLPLKYPIRDYPTTTIDHPHPVMLLSQNILYFFFLFNLFFYDFDNPTVDGCPQRVFGCFPDVPRPFTFETSAPLFPFILGGGDGDFCLIWSPEFSNMIHCFRFRIDLGFTSDDEPFRHATYLGCDRFALDGAHLPIKHYGALPRY